MNSILGLSQHSVGKFYKVLLAVAAIVIASAVATAQSSVIVSEEFTWQSQSVAQTTCETYKHTLTGPGVLTIRTKMSPFRVRDLGMSSEDILTHNLGFFAEGLGGTINGMQGADSSKFLGKSIDRISRWKIEGNKHNVEFRVCNPVKCNLAGDCSQQQATASIVVDFAAASSVQPTTSGRSTGSATLSANIIGTWVVIENGKVVDRIDVTAYGDGYRLELRAGDNSPIYASGFGVLQGNRLISSTRNASTSASGLVVMTFDGSRVHYRSYYVDGRQAWDGDFTRRP